MYDAIRYWLTFRRNCNFQGWVRENFSDSELRRAIEEIANAELVRPDNPFSEFTLGQQAQRERTLRRATVRLYRRYGEEIWAACFRASPQKHPLDWLGSFATLKNSYQVNRPEIFEEFMVRHAFRQTAVEIMDSTLVGTKAIDPSE